MEFKVFFFVFTLFLMFTQSFSAPSGNEADSFAALVKNLELLRSNPQKSSDDYKPTVDRLGGGNLL